MPYFERVQQQLRALHPHIPLPPTAAIQLSQHLALSLQQQIAQHGPMPFVQFMQQLLYAPGLGYYSAGLAKLGAEGDFVTAPEISPLFSQTLARCFSTQLLKDNQSVLELGAGRGVMAATMLRYWQQQNCLPEHYFILEVSADLRAVQRQTIAAQAPDCLDRVHWLEQWPRDFCGVVVANEVLDAMPHCLFEIRDQQVFERAVSVDANTQFQWTLLPPNPSLQQWFDTLPNEIRDGLVDGYQSEVLLDLKPWLQALYSSLQQAHIVLIDYGFPQHEFYLPERSQGTLMCHYRHTAHADPLTLIGLQDVTCHIDFSAVANAAFDCGFAIDGYSSQASFLQNNDILSLANGHDTAEQFKHAQALKRLLLPSEMGELFKVISLSKNADTTLTGFALNDRRHSL